MGERAGSEDHAPDLMMPEEEELFIEPELKELGEENAVKQ